jgi:hypothetical protein
MSVEYHTQTQIHTVLVLRAGIEPARPQWPQDFKSCVSTSSTTRATIKKALSFERAFRAEDRARTGHPDLGKVVLYQMSYFR